MLTYTIIFAASYLALFQWLPLFQDSPYGQDYVAQTIRHLVLLYLSNQLTSFLWRQKFVSELSQQQCWKRYEY